jgi:hypothetical protein
MVVVLLHLFFGKVIMRRVTLDDHWGIRTVVTEVGVGSHGPRARLDTRCFGHSGRGLALLARSLLASNVFPCLLD